MSKDPSPDTLKPTYMLHFDVLSGAAIKRYYAFLMFRLFILHIIYMGNKSKISNELSSVL